MSFSLCDKQGLAGVNFPCGGLCSCRAGTLGALGLQQVLLQAQSTGSRVVAPRFEFAPRHVGYSWTGSNPCLLDGQNNSSPLSHQDFFREVACSYPILCPGGTGWGWGVGQALTSLCTSLKPLPSCLPSTFHFTLCPSSLRTLTISSERKKVPQAPSLGQGFINLLPC